MNQIEIGIHKEGAVGECEDKGHQKGKKVPSLTALVCFIIRHVNTQVFHQKSKDFLF